MRLTAAHVREAAIIAGACLAALGAVGVEIELFGRDSSALPGAVSGIFIALWFFLISRYGPRRPVEPRRLRRQMLVAFAGWALIAVGGLIAAYILMPS